MIRPGIVGSPNPLSGTAIMNETTTKFAPKARLRVCESNFNRLRQPV